jgi:hypothetical protein
MARQIHIVAILLMVQGALECMMGILLGIAGLVFPSMFTWMNEMGKQQPPPPGGGPAPEFPQEMAWLMFAIYLGLGVVTLLVGVLRILAGVQNVRYQGRTFGIVALFLGVVPFFTCYCAPTSLGLMIYGLIVYFSHDSAHAFEWRKQGKTPEEIWHRLTRPRHGPDEDFGERSIMK